MVAPFPRLWFRAFNRPTPALVLDVLVKGDTPHPDRTKRTGQCEDRLGVPAGQVYTYLSRFNPDFGYRGVALPYDACATGTVSPFDSGNVVDTFEPTKAWDTMAQASAVMAFSWPRAQLDRLLRTWPGGVGWNGYCRGSRPGHDGPHVPFSRKPDLPIWSHDANDWSAWVWELRVPALLPFGASIHRWTCPADELDEIMEVAKLDPVAGVNYMHPWTSTTSPHRRSSSCFASSCRW